MKQASKGMLVIIFGTLIGLTTLTTVQSVSAINIVGVWKLNTNGQKADLKITKVVGGQITGTYHATCTSPLTCRPYSSNIFGFWDETAMKIVFLKENKLVFDNPKDTIACNTVKPDGDPCHGRDIAFTGYLFGGPPGSPGFTNPLMMAGVAQVFAGLNVNGQAGIYPGGGIGGANAVRNTFGWCATYQVDMCGPPVGNISPMSGTATSNMSTTAK